MPIWPAQPPESTAYLFTRDERARLTIYRRAVAAGFYSEESEELTRLPAGQATGAEVPSQDERN